MFDANRFFGFVGRVLGIAIPFLLIAAALAFLTECLTREASPAELVSSATFWLAVALDMVPVTAAMGLTLWLPARFLRAGYHLESWRQGLGFLLRSRCGLPGFAPWVKVREGRVAEGGSPILAATGGRGRLVIFNDSAVVLERGGRLTRVEGVGKLELEPFEGVYDAIDLRPKRALHTVQALSREGIPIQWKIEIHYQLDGGKTAPTDDVPYPFVEEHVLRASTGKWVHHTGGSGLLDWEGRLVVAEADRMMRILLADRQLDELIGLTEKEGQAARVAVQAELAAALSQAAPKVGARILSVELDNLQVDDQVTDEWIRAWQTEWEKWSAVQLAPAEASLVHRYETVKAEAQMQMVSLIARELQERIANRVIPSQTVPHMVLLRLFSVLDRAEFAPNSRVFFPTQTMSALDNLRRLLASGRAADSATVHLTAAQTHIPVNGQTDLQATVQDAWGNPVPDGTVVSFTTTLGTVAADLALTVAGQARSTLQADGRSGLAVITVLSGGASAKAAVQIG